MEVGVGDVAGGQRPSVGGRTGHPKPRRRQDSSTRGGSSVQPLLLAPDVKARGPMSRAAPGSRCEGQGTSVLSTGPGPGPVEPSGLMSLLPCTMSSSGGSGGQGWWTRAHPVLLQG